VLGTTDDTRTARQAGAGTRQHGAGLGEHQGQGGGRRTGDGPRPQGSPTGAVSRARLPEKQGAARSQQRSFAHAMEELEMAGGRRAGNWTQNSDRRARQGSQHGGHGEGGARRVELHGAVAMAERRGEIRAEEHRAGERAGRARHGSRVGLDKIQAGREPP
jgi:hypothetical protein